MDALASMTITKSAIRLIAGLALGFATAFAPVQIRAQESAVSGVPVDSGGGVRAYAVPPGSIDEVLRRLNERFPTNSGVRFVHDARTSQILAFGPAAVQQQVSAIVQAAGGMASPSQTQTQPSVAGGAAVDAKARGPKVVPLRHLTWRDFEAQLSAIFGKTLPVTLEHGGDWARYTLETRGGRVNLIVDRKAGQVALEGPVRLADAWSHVVESLDQHPQQANDDTRVVPLGAAKTAD